MNYNKDKIEYYKQRYPSGTQIELISMDDPYRYMPAGLKGIVTSVDDACQIHCAWENGSSLALVPGVDSFRIVTEQEQAAEPDYEPENDEENILKKLRLHERTLIYSEVTLDADGETTSFLTGGMPDAYNIEGVDQYREFAETLSEDTAISVTVESRSVGNGESEKADEEEAILIETNREYLDKVFGIDPLQTATFTEYVQESAYDYDDESDEGMEL